MQCHDALKLFTSRDKRPLYELARDMGQSMNYIYTTMGRKSYRVSTFTLLCDCLGCTLSVMLDGEQIPFPFQDIRDGTTMQVLVGILASIGCDVVMTGSDGYSVTLSPPDWWEL